MAETVIEVNNLTKMLGGKKVLHGVSFEASRGEIIVIAGPNGAGKTTLLKIIAGLEEADEGYVSVKGSISYLPETDCLPYSMSCYEAVEALGSSWGCVEDVVGNVLGLDKVKNFRSRKLLYLSKGERRLIQLAAILCLDRDIYILDEPFTGIASENIIKISNILRRVKGNRTFVITLHGVHEALLLSPDRLYWLEEGRLVTRLSLNPEVYYVEVLHKDGMTSFYANIDRVIEALKVLAGHPISIVPLFLRVIPHGRG